MLTIFLVEEKPFLEAQLRLTIYEKQIEVIGSEKNVQEAFWNISRLQPDVVLLDLDYVEEAGIHLATQLNSLRLHPLLVFTSTEDTYISKTFEHGAFDYLIKPFDQKRLKNMIDKLIHYDQDMHDGHFNKIEKSQETIVRNKYTDKFIIKLADRIKVINTDEIVCIGTENRQVFVKTLEGKYPVDTPLYRMEKKLGPSFIRIHRSFIINIYYITEIQPWFNGTYTLLFKDGSTTPVSRSHIKSIRGILEF